MLSSGSWKNLWKKWFEMGLAGWLKRLFLIGGGMEESCVVKVWLWPFQWTFLFAICMFQRDWFVVEVEVIYDLLTNGLFCLPSWLFWHHFDTTPKPFLMLKANLEVAEVQHGIRLVIAGFGIASIRQLSTMKVTKPPWNGGFHRGLQ